jgi:hypothetical protein
MPDELAGGGRVIARRERLGLALHAFCESLAESHARPRRDREPTFRSIRTALRHGRAVWRLYP